MYTTKLGWGQDSFPCLLDLDITFFYIGVKQLAYPQVLVSHYSPKALVLKVFQSKFLATHANNASAKFENLSPFTCLYYFLSFKRYKKKAYLESCQVKLRRFMENIHSKQNLTTFLLPTRFYPNPKRFADTRNPSTKQETSIFQEGFYWVNIS